jgi:hypothetical protein
MIFPPFFGGVNFQLPHGVSLALPLTAGNVRSEVQHVPQASAKSKAEAQAALSLQDQKDKAAARSDFR